MTKRANGTLLATLLLLGGCGFGTAGVVAAVHNGNGSANAPSTASGLVVLQPKVSPATIRLVLTDAEADAVTVEFAYVLPGSGGQEQLMTQVGPNPVTLAASAAGTEHTLSWAFSGEPGLPSNGSFVDGVTMIARVRGGVAQTTVVGLGNDAPVVTRGDPAAERDHGRRAGGLPRAGLVGRRRRRRRRVLRRIAAGAGLAARARPAGTGGVDCRTLVHRHRRGARRRRPDVLLGHELGTG
jgi:hypothetical protein